MARGSYKEVQWPGGLVKRCCNGIGGLTKQESNDAKD